ncbi:uncharacterized protein LOC110190275 [Drosophila serrata]|uniref:uncharacterized protein LOC110190275 n=1 Tax=Drosophila serrata TaxID=7274 RepID=UPI000A1D1584|nr:uncharacterized protein LOC110190275 [Drosophila serrata]KAH8360400.1 hypothetical protein KR200_004024 [Drosophila serrata]
MLKIPNRSKMPMPPQQPRTTNIERPTPGKRLNPLKLSSVQPPALVARSKPKLPEISELNQRLLAIQKRVAEWKSKDKHLK